MTTASGAPTAASARVALVTGATGGMGLAICAELAAAEWAVARTDLPGTGVEFEADLRAPEAAAQIVQSVIQAHGRFDLLINNAATMYHGDLSLEDLPRWWDTIDVNLSAPFRLARAAAGELRKNEGQIINLASTLSVTGEAGFSAYCASKSGIVGLTKALARELAPKVRVNAVAPGDTDTPQQDVDAKAAGLTRAELYARHAQTIPIGRILEPTETARLIRYLAGETGYTGACIHLNGGKVML
jgi:NAD(P)-dependent dehydrogenase (short-subunit alcohol dehydrogenase family)